MSDEPVGEAWKYNPDYHRMSDFLGVDKYDRGDYEIAQKVSIIRDWAGLQGKDDSTDSALKAVYKLKKSMGTQSQGKELINQLFHNIRLNMNKQPAPVRPQPKSQVKKVEMKKEIPIKQQVQQTKHVQKMVNQQVQQSVQGMVRNVLKDKSILSNAIQSALKESFNAKS